MPVPPATTLPREASAISGSSDRVTIMSASISTITSAGWRIGATVLSRKCGASRRPGTIVTSLSSSPRCSPVSPQSSR